MLYVYRNILRVIVIPTSPQAWPPIIRCSTGVVHINMAVVVILRLHIIVAVVDGGHGCLIIAVTAVKAVTAADWRGIMAIVNMPNSLGSLLILTVLIGALTISILHRKSLLALIALRAGVLAV